jgi:dihydrofolate reductase
LRKVKLYIASSFDHFIARANGDISWLELPEYAIKGEDYGYEAFLKTIDTTLMGHTTYKIVEGFDMPWPYEGFNNYVFTTNRELTSNNHVQFIHEDLATFVRQLKYQDGKDIWLVGGGQINQMLLNYNLIDEMIITFMPIMLGHGVRLFHGVVKEKKLNLIDSKHFPNGVLQLKYVR